MAQRIGRCFVVEITDAYKFLPMIEIKGIGKYFLLSKEKKGLIYGMVLLPRKKVKFSLLSLFYY